MVKTASTMLRLGTVAPDFSLPATDGRIVARSDFSGRPLLVIFLCNHCPFVKHLADHLAVATSGWIDRGLAVVGISSNDAEKYPQDGPEAMADEANSRGYRFPYLFDGDQQIAIAYQAACTPDFFLFDRDHRLVYRGQYDDSRPSNGVSISGADLTAAVDAVLSGRDVPELQKPSIGCNIKWKPGAEPQYFDPKGTG
ncbi:MAG TPA: thioredoxin family protein [Planctomycetaceae bacterium]|nr:thioredoxin family protein [Planctomycetaceae bacterium]HRF00186.1 thioredoxin family protein [Pirellulaceae bacterium]